MVRLKNDYDSPAPKFNSLARAILKVTKEKASCAAGFEIRLNAD